MERKKTELGTLIVGRANHSHQDVGTGVVETVYEVTFAAKLRKRGLLVERQVPVSIESEGQRFAEGFRAKSIIERELKSLAKVQPASKNPFLSYHHVTGMKRGYLFNLGETRMKGGFARIVCGAC